MTFTIQRIAHELEVRLLTVTAARDLTPSLRRITLTGALEHFVSASPDDHIKLIFPFPGQTEIELPQPGERGISRTAERPPMRDYTPRRFDADAGELVIDIVVHGDGPGATWAASAQPGTQVGQVGPRGSGVIDGVPDWYLLAGDEAAIPSIARRLEELPHDVRALVFIEVGGPRDETPIAAGPHVDLAWLHRGSRTPGDALIEAVTGVELPAGDGYVWVATEASAARTLRTHLRQERGLSKAATKVTGYWKIGATDHHDPPDDG